MPVHCAAFGCVQRRSVHTRREGITFHRFPKAGDQRIQWEVALKREGYAASDASMLCSKHFRQENFDRTGQIVRIRPGVVPSIFAFPAHLIRSTASTERTTSTSRRASLPIDRAQDAPLEPAALPQSQLVDHTYALSSCPTALKEGYIKARDNVTRLQREKRNTRKRELRAKSSLQDMLIELRDKNLMTEDLSQRLGLYADLPLHLFEKKANEYSKEQREFAITLHLHGPKAYHYLRSTLQLPLPHPRSLQRWLSSLDERPGLNSMMLNMLGRKYKEDPEKHGHVSLMIDAMSIKKHLQYNPRAKRMSGYVDLGNGFNETDPATEALVLMVVGLKGHWKAPIGYFLTKTLTADTQKELMVHALEALHERSIKVVCLTMDGHATNLGMCNLLGTNLKGNPKDPLRTSFLHPSSSHEVFVIMDACHMLKLARNMLESYRTINSCSGRIEWKHIVELNNVQKKAGLHAANKLTDTHVHFDNQKMKVSLAAQTLSNSVAVALRTLKDLGYAQFNDCEATVEFLQTIDRLFDILNSRNPRARGFKAPLGNLNWSYKLEFLSKARKYLIDLVMMDGKPLHQSKRYLSVMGFVINIDTLMRMIPQLLEEQQYVLTYRFSQDHLELLFNSIRASGGWNNNPTAGQFQGIFRKLMFRCGVKPVDSGNVTGQDDTVTLSAEHYTRVSLSAAEMSSADASTAEELLSPFLNISALVGDHSYLPTRFGGLVDNALVYIAGFVVRCILRSLSCDVCRASLVTDAVAVPVTFDQSYHLLELRNNGGLMIPSKGTVKVVRAAERAIRRQSPGKAPDEVAVAHFVREEIGTEDVFELGSHVEETQFGIDNHLSLLLSLVVSVFMRIRLHHIAKLTSLTWQRGNTRKKLGKTILFQGF